MATASKAEKKTKAPKSKSLPKGFKPARQRLDGFFAREEGNSATGILRGSFEVKGKFGARRVYRVELVDGETQVGDGEMVGPGAMIGIDETGYTKALGDIEPGTGIFIRYEGKDGPGEKDPHIFTLGVAE
jgi:hypothetical protein